MSSNTPVPPTPASPTTTGAVRRHHTISAHSRSARAAAKDVISEETSEQQQQQGIWNDDEVVDDDWVGGVGAVGEKTSLHRQASLPTRYHRGTALICFRTDQQNSYRLLHYTLLSGFQKSAPKPSAQGVNSLAAIAGHEGDEEPWKIDSYNVDDDEHESLESNQAAQHQQIIEAQAQSQASNSPMSPHFAAGTVPSPPPAGSGVRRHVSLTYGAAVGGQGRKVSAGLKRSGTLQASMPPQQHAHQNPSPPETSEGHESEEYVYEPEDPSVYQDEYIRQQQQYPNNNIGNQNAWSSGNEWRPNYGPGGNGNIAIDDVQQALSALELNSGQPPMQPNYGQYQQQPQSFAQPPRFNSTQAPRGNNGGYNNYNANNNGGRSQQEFEGRKTPNSQRGGYMPQQQYGQQDRSGSWDQKDSSLRGRASNPNLQYGYQQQQTGGHSKAASGSSVPSVPPIPVQYLQQQNQAAQPNRNTSFETTAPTVPTQPPILDAPIDVPTLIATKGYNPAQFDTRPQFARFFVIKSYTEDDVHKSLKYEIWSSTDPGNKRLDKAFKDTAGRGPIYLFFSVNASGHFCGMAEMLTPVDYSRSSTVWASDKWKGVFKVRWIFVRDIPNMNLRHIKLMNTQEKKPVTNSRDTQELLPDAGQEMLRIFHSHPSRTSLLQDFAFYELQAMQKVATGTSSPPVLASPQLQAAIPNAAAAGFNPAAYGMPQMMQMGMGIGQYGGGQQGLQAMHQSVMRHPSPGPPQQGQQQGQQSQQGNYGNY
ncbi:YT521-B-like domain-containing protein [Crepidotus variabilis]|uniref:YT521-B-like domain-containing protein n=1 Tax=Crepidotus variabilis TaxID=179855 RepID=A0A9P6JNS2_9AGAR|nr:YT521-B-like domain-containing protein [Crepidotus variabilis]